MFRFVLKIVFFVHSLETYELLSQKMLLHAIECINWTPDIINNCKIKAKTNNSNLKIIYFWGPEFFKEYFCFNKDNNTLPPSSGKAGIKLKIAVTKFA